MKGLVYITFLLFSLSLFGQLEKLNGIYEKSRNFCKNIAVDSTLHYTNLLIAEAEKINSLEFCAKANVIKGHLYLKMGNSKQALPYFFSALKICKQTNDLNYQSYILNNIAIIYFNQKSYSEAKQFWDAELAIRERIGDTLKLFSSLVNSSMLYNSVYQFDRGNYLLLKAKKLEYKIKDTSLLINYFNTQAFHYYLFFLNKNNIDINNYDPGNHQLPYVFEALLDSAELYWKKSANIWSNNYGKLQLLTPTFNLASLYRTKKDNVKALQQLTKAKSILLSINYSNGQGTSETEYTALLENLAGVYYDLGDYKNASNNYRELVAQKDSLRKVEATDFNKQLAKQYELETNSKINQQQLELNLKNIQLANQQKKIYLYVLIFVILLFLIVFILIYLNFNKRLHKRINDAKEKFFVNIMHEIRTPLSMIQAPLKTLKPKLNDAEDKYFIELAEKNVVRLNELVNQMLDLSKVDNSNYKLSNSVGQFNEFIKHVVSNFEKLAIEREINFVPEISISAQTFVFDRDALEKIITNLLSNAFKFTPPPGTVGITISIDNASDKPKLFISVWDTGIGIAKSEQDKLFTRFFRSEKSKHNIAGMGVGLSLVKEIVSAYKGKISFQSEEKRGSTFMVELELEYPAEYPLNTAIDISLPVVLIVEDDKDILDFTSTFLRSKGITTIKASDGNVAKSILENTTPHLIVTDLMMAELDGLAFINYLKADKGLDHIPIIVLSAKNSEKSRVEALNTGIQAFISKPFLPDELFSVIHNQLELISKVKTELNHKLEKKEVNQTVEQKFSSSEPYVQKLFDLIFENIDNSELTIEALADMMATNRSHFQRKIKNLTSYSPSEIVKLIRLEKSKEFLLAKKGNITEIAYMSGFSSQSYFTKCFTQHYGYPPTQIFEQTE